MLTKYPVAMHVILFLFFTIKVAVKKQQQLVSSPVYSALKF